MIRAIEATTAALMAARIEVSANELPLIRAAFDSRGTCGFYISSIVALRRCVAFLALFHWIRTLH